MMANVRENLMLLDYLWFSKKWTNCLQLTQASTSSLLFAIHATPADIAITYTVNTGTCRPTPVCCFVHINVELCRSSFDQINYKQTYAVCKSCDKKACFIIGLHVQKMSLFSSIFQCMKRLKMFQAYRTKWTGRTCRMSVAPPAVPAAPGVSTSTRSVNCWANRGTPSASIAVSRKQKQLN